MDDCGGWWNLHKRKEHKKLILEVTSSLYGDDVIMSYGPYTAKTREKWHFFDQKSSFFLIHEKIEDYSIQIILAWYKSLMRIDPICTPPLCPPQWPPLERTAVMDSRSCDFALWWHTSESPQRLWDCLAQTLKSRKTENFTKSKKKMLKILFLTCIIQTKTEINIHDQYGCVTEEKKQRFFHPQDNWPTKVLSPVQKL